MKKMILLILAVLTTLFLLLTINNTTQAFHTSEGTAKIVITQAMIYDKPAPKLVNHAGKYYKLIGDKAVFIDAARRHAKTMPLAPTINITPHSDNTNMVKQTSEVISARDTISSKWCKQQENVLTWQNVDYTKNDTINYHIARALIYRAVQRTTKPTFLHFAYRQYRYFNHEVNQQYADSVAPIHSEVTN
ncbi:hypothetical protein EQG49_02735 [Periweissella cryptocerci]|uniref:Uncharacterized protein n=1 Tax=Periweissella cryptocerci TaxID=2506420 RepID=A0A4P6YS05_9LACO|nr:hypothetical protein [Periweissella cryptocerci]QBO35458.1 hypothetical protein EQG49_02735 [Periweissella cryptocerci]